jgi:hypothetical protein
MAHKRYQVYVDPKRIDAIKEHTDLSETAIFVSGIALLEWALSERNKGRAIGSIGRQTWLLNMPHINLVTSI